MERCHTRTAFSLIELLVVISIISLLAAMLLPAIGMVRSAAIKTSCMSRLGQVGLSLATYANDNENIFPPIAGENWHAQLAWGFAGTPHGFSFLMPDYLEADVINQVPNKSLWCPSFKAADGSFGYRYYGNVRFGSSTSCWDPPAIPGVDIYYPYALGPGQILRNPNIPSSPSNTPLAWDNIEENGTGAPKHPHPLDNIQRSPGAFPLVPGGNTLYADGHVGWVQGHNWVYSIQVNDTRRYRPPVGL